MFLPKSLIIGQFALILKLTIHTYETREGKLAMSNVCNFVRRKQQTHA